MPRNLGKHIGAVVAVVTVLTGAGTAIDHRYAKAADMAKALSDIHQGLQDLRLGQLQTKRALLAAELFNYDLRGTHLSALEAQRAQSIRNELSDLDRKIGALESVQDGR